MPQIELIIKVALITCFFSFGVQSLFYLYYKFFDPDFLKEHNHVFNYWSGFVGDGILVPMANVFAFFTLNIIGISSLEQIILCLSFLVGFLVVFISHSGQKRYDHKNWTMPEKGRWNILGTYHAIFMFSETIFLAYVFFSFLQYLSLHGAKSVFNLPIKYAFLVLLLFFISFLFDYRQIFFKKIYSRIEN